jgi:acylpyruvate hydrolase
VILKFKFFSIPTLIEHVSSIMKLEVGDVILTGTPSGVGPIQAGEIVTAGLRPEGQESDLVELKFDVINRKGGFAFKEK